MPISAAYGATFFADEFRLQRRAPLGARRGRDGLTGMKRRSCHRRLSLSPVASPARIMSSPWALYSAVRQLQIRQHGPRRYCSSRFQQLMPLRARHIAARAESCRLCSRSCEDGAAQRAHLRVKFRDVVPAHAGTHASAPGEEALCSEGRVSTSTSSSRRCAWRHGTQSMLRAARTRRAGLETVARDTDNTEHNEFASLHCRTRRSSVPVGGATRASLPRSSRASRTRAAFTHDTDVVGVPVDARRRGQHPLLIVPCRPCMPARLIWPVRALAARSAVPTRRNKSGRQARCPKILFRGRRSSGVEELSHALLARTLLGLISDVEVPARRRLSRGAGFELARRAPARARPADPKRRPSRAEFAGRRSQKVGAAFLRKCTPTRCCLRPARLLSWRTFAFATSGSACRTAPRWAARRTSRTRAAHPPPCALDSLVAATAGENHFSRWFTCARTGVRASSRASCANARPRLRVAGPSGGATCLRAIGGISRVGGARSAARRGLAFVRFLFQPHHRITRQFPGVRIEFRMLARTDVRRVPRAQSTSARSRSNATTTRRLRGGTRHREAAGVGRRRPARVPQPGRWPLAVRFVRPARGLTVPAVHRRPTRSCSRTTARRSTSACSSSCARSSRSTRPRSTNPVKDCTRRRSGSSRSDGESDPARRRHARRSLPIRTSPASRVPRNFIRRRRSSPRTVSPPWRSAWPHGGRGRADARSCPRAPRHILQFSTMDDVLADSQREFLGDRDGPPSDIEPAAGRKPACANRTSASTSPDATARCSRARQHVQPENNVIYDGLSRRRASRDVRAGAQSACSRSPRCSTSCSGWGDVGMNRQPRSSSPRGSQNNENEPHGRVPADAPAVVVARRRHARREPQRRACASCATARACSATASSPTCATSCGGLPSLRPLAQRRGCRPKWRSSTRSCSRKRRYLLIGVGRWGSTDPWLGIPVTWGQISARVIIEASFRDFRVTPSQGSHFFQNLTSFQIGYLP